MQPRVEDRDGQRTAAPRRLARPHWAAEAPMTTEDNGTRGPGTRSGGVGSLKNLTTHLTAVSDLSLVLASKCPRLLPTQRHSVAVDRRLILPYTDSCCVFADQ